MPDHNFLRSYARNDKVTVISQLQLAWCFQFFYLIRYLFTHADRNYVNTFWPARRTETPLLPSLLYPRHVQRHTPCLPGSTRELGWGPSL